MNIEEKIALTLGGLFLAVVVWCLFSCYLDDLLDSNLTDDEFPWL